MIFRYLGVKAQYCGYFEAHTIKKKLPLRKAKMKSKTIKLIFSILLISVNNLLGMGIGDWHATTKNKTSFNDSGGGLIITLANGKEYKYPDEWYFYKDNIIGIGEEYIEGRHKYEYFIIKEREGDILTFDRKDSWEEFIKTNDLNPKYWKRCFRDNWNHIEMIKILAVFWFPISVPIILLNIYFYRRLLDFDNSWGKWASLAAIAPILIMIINILGKFPDSL